MSTSAIPELTIKAIRAQDIAIGMFIGVPSHRDDFMALSFQKVFSVWRTEYWHQGGAVEPGIRVQIGYVGNYRDRIFKLNTFVLVGMTEEPDAPEYEPSDTCSYCKCDLS